MVCGNCIWCVSKVKSNNSHLRHCVNENIKKNTYYTTVKPSKEACTQWENARCGIEEDEKDPSLFDSLGEMKGPRSR